MFYEVVNRLLIYKQIKRFKYLQLVLQMMLQIILVALKNFQC